MTHSRPLNIIPAMVRRSVLARCASNFTALFAVLLFQHPLSGAENPVSFARDIAPVLMDSCLDCHRPGKTKGGYRLDTFEALLKPGESGKSPFVAGKPQESHLLSLLKAADPDDRMPQKADPLPRARIEAVERWIQAGMPFDGPSKTNSMAEWDHEQGKNQAPEVYSMPIPITAVLPVRLQTHSPALLAVAGYHEVLVIDREKPTPWARIQGMPERITAMVQVPGSSAMMVVGGTPGKRGEVWKLSGISTTSAPPQKLLVMGEVAVSAAVSSDSKWLAVAGGDQTLRVYSMDQQKWMPTIEAHSDWVLHVAFSDDSTPAGNSESGQIRESFRVAVVGTTERLL